MAQSNEVIRTLVTPQLGTQAQLALLVQNTYRQALYFPSEIYLITDDLTIPSTCTIQYDDGAIINIATGKTLTVNGNTFGPEGTNLFQGAGVVVGAGDFTRPTVDWVDGAVLEDGGDIVIRGRNLLQSQTFDSITLWLTTSAVTVTALKPGNTGYTLQITDGATAGSEVVGYTAGVITVQIEAAVSTGDQIATAINADGSAANGYVRATSAGAGTTNAVAAATALTGGTIDPATTSVKVSNVECLPANETGATTTAKWADTSITVTVPDLTGESTARATGDQVSVVVSLGGVDSYPVNVVLTT